ncbi:MAG: arginine--tRNA ligase [Fibrobacterota bacterium]
MSSLSTILTDIFSSAFEQLGLEKRFGQVIESGRPDLGQFQCNGALACAKQTKQNPRKLAENIIEIVRSQEILENLTIAGPGFINITLSDSFLAHHIGQMHNDERLGCPKTESPKKVIIDFGGPNVAKPMHVGHLRSSIIGDCLQRLIRFLGHEVTSDNHMGDWGTQMGMLICELKRQKPQLPYFQEQFSGEYPAESPVTIQDLETMYPQASQRCKTNPEDMAEAVAATSELQRGRKGYVALWKHFVALSVAELQRDFSSLGISFDHWLGESHYKERMEELVNELRRSPYTEISEGALIIPVARKDDKKEIPPLLIEKSGGGFLYGTSDLATIQERVERFGAEEILYVVDKRQGLHFEQVFRAARKTGIAPESVTLKHLGFGTVNGPDGKPFKTREGGVMKLSELIVQVTQKARLRMEEAGVAQGFSEQEKALIAGNVGLAALKFADLSNHRESNYIFDLDKFTQFEGKTGPYLLYSAVRIKSILRNAAKKGISGGPILSPADPERKLMLVMGQMPDIFQSTRESYLPNYLCDFAYSLSQEFNRFYRECHILNESDKARQASWVSLIEVVLRQMELTLSILGIDVPERM